MKSDELKSLFNRIFGLNPWPEKFEVDAETYGNCCQEVFDYIMNHNKDQVLMSSSFDEFAITVILGPNNGLMFKNVELILRKE